MIAAIKKAALAFFLSFALATGAVAVHSVAAPSQAEAGILKKAKTGLKIIGKGARKLEKTMARKGKLGRAIAKGARGLRKGVGQANRGISNVQRGVGRAVGKVCKRNCRKVLKAANKVRKGLDRLQDQVEAKCARFGRTSKACRVARNALSFASPL